MTITRIGAGTSATGNNASVLPTAHASTAVGDLVLIPASIRNSGTGYPNLPTGWTRIAGAPTDCFQVFGKVWAVADVIPTITFTGGAANADTIAQCETYRAAEAYAPTVAVTATQLNGAATSVAYPALTSPGADCATLIYVWRQDDATSYTNPAGFSAGPVSNPTAGSDASQASFYRLTGASVSASSVAGTMLSAISRSIVVFLRPAAALAVTEQDVYPTRLLLSLTGLQLGDDVALYRSVAGERTLVRAGAMADVTDTAFLRVDAELPFGVPVTYVAVVNGAVEYSAGPTTYDLAGGQVVLSDAVNATAAECAILNWPERGYRRPSTRYKVGDRNVVVAAAGLGQFEGQIELICYTTSSVENVLSLINTATQGIVQIRQPGGYDRVDCYVIIDAVNERRMSQDGDDDRRTLVLEVAEVTGWADAFEARGYTLQDVADYYGAAGTLQTIADDARFSTLLGLAQAEFPT